VYVVAIETDAAGAAKLEQAVREQLDVEFDIQEVQAQVGDPDTWMFVAQVAPAALATLSAPVLALIGQRKIKYIKVGDREFRDITPAQLREVQAALGASDRGQA
jgi:hypothetical protein